MNMINQFQLFSEYNKLMNQHACRGQVLLERMVWVGVRS